MPLSLQIDILNQSFNEFSKECLKGDTLIEGKDWCLTEKLRLDQDYERLDKLLKEQTAQSQKPKCDPKDSNQEALLADIDQIVAESIKDSDSKKCDSNTEVLSTKCLQDISCASYNALMKYPAFETVAPKIQSCNGKTSQSNCVVELVNGLVKNLYHNVKAIAHDIPVLLKNAAISGWDWLFGVEDKTSDALAAATQTSDKSLVQWAQDKIGFFTSVVSNIMNAINDGIKESFGCGQWESTPHFSKCLKPMDAWTCSDCVQKLNAACGVVGYLGGEIVSMYLTGGALAVGKAVVQAGKVAVTGLGRSAVRALGVDARLSALVSQGGALGARAMSSLKVPITVMASTLSQASGKLKNIKIPLPESARRAAVIASAGVKVTTYPVNKYFKLLSDATNLGYQHGSGAVYMAAKSGRVVALGLALESGIKTTRVISLDAQSANALRQQSVTTIPHSDYKIKFDSDKSTVTIEPNKLN